MILCHSHGIETLITKTFFCNTIFRRHLILYLQIVILWNVFYEKNKMIENKISITINLISLPISPLNIDNQMDSKSCQTLGRFEWWQTIFLSKQIKRLRSTRTSTRGWPKNKNKSTSFNINNQDWFDYLV